MLERTRSVIIGVAHIFAAASGLELDHNSEQPMIEGLLVLGCDLGIPLCPLHRHGCLVSGRRQGFGTRQRRCRLELGGLGGGGLRFEVHHPLFELSDPSGLKGSCLLGNLFVEFLQPREALGDGGTLTLGLIYQSLQIIQPCSIGPAVGNVQQESASWRYRTDRWRKILYRAVDRRPQRDETGVDDRFHARKLEQALHRTHSGNDDDPEPERRFDRARSIARKKAAALGWWS